ncbi:hypothetical protein EVAR_16239_1 [Eumeta japonica]|uniref:Uncharacterized protein n=1 Tax=Eumeta variegata TaxID=151549 RepID=A0A4C1U5W0_EUMVA|nr:hypothetical protein EVAR_16239_1 [Eumeta japonica]
MDDSLLSPRERGSQKTDEGTLRRKRKEEKRGRKRQSDRLRAKGRVGEVEQERTGIGITIEVGIRIRVTSDLISKSRIKSRLLWEQSHGQKLI